MQRPSTVRPTQPLPSSNSSLSAPRRYSTTPPAPNWSSSVQPRRSSTVTEQAKNRTRSFKLPSLVPSRSNNRSTSSANSKSTSGYSRTRPTTPPPKLSSSAPRRNSSSSVSSRSGVQPSRGSVIPNRGRSTGITLIPEGVPRNRTQINLSTRSASSGTRPTNVRIFECQQPNSRSLSSVPRCKTGTGTLGTRLSNGSGSGTSAISSRNRSTSSKMRTVAVEQGTAAVLTEIFPKYRTSTFRTEQTRVALTVTRKRKP